MQSTPSHRARAVHVIVNIRTLTISFDTAQFKVNSFTLCDYLIELFCYYYFSNGMACVVVLTKIYYEIQRRHIRKCKVQFSLN